MNFLFIVSVWTQSRHDFHVMKHQVIDDYLLVFVFTLKFNLNLFDLEHEELIQRMQDYVSVVIDQDE